MLKAALCGNPNCGKTTLYNRLTGQRQAVGNWAGVTVQGVYGELRIKNERCILIDLPGIYSLSAFSLEEKAAWQALIKEEPDLILSIVDATNLERSLYLSLQLLTLGRPVLIAVNMLDALRSQGGWLDCAALEDALGVPVLPICARSGEGVARLCEAALRQARAGKTPPALSYSQKAGQALNQIERMIAVACQARRLPAAFYAARLLAGDSSAEQELGLSENVLRQIDGIASAYAAPCGGDRAAMLAGERYRLIARMAAQALHPGGGERERTERIDSLLLHRLLALPIFFLMLFVVFSVTFGPAGRMLKGMLEGLNGQLGMAAERLLLACGAPEWTRSLLCDAVIGGVGGVLSFLPQMALLFLSLALLEDSGYMARAAFLMDRPLRALGLGGKSFIPMLMGFGCTTPAVMAARAMGSERERRMTVLLVPFMSCGARLPIYALFSSTFFPGKEGRVVFFLYLTGIAAALLCGIFLKNSSFAGKPSPFILELPSYRMPRLADTLRHTGERCKGFLYKAGTVIFAMNIVCWLLQHLTPGMLWTGDAQGSIFAYLGRVIAPVFTPLGFGGWQEAVALLGGLIAKESVVSTLGILYGAGSPAALSAAIRTRFTPLSALSFMVFCLLYMPCLSAFATICRELHSLRQGLAAAVLQTAIAYLAAFLVYSFGLYSPLNG